jgi:hypothetical protein
MRFMLGPSAAASIAAVLSLSSCQVYDPELLDQRARQAAVHASDASADAADAAELSDGSAFDTGDATEVAAPACGDGIVNGDERCDIAIARGVSGACPDGCSGGRGCSRNELAGEGCDARCEPRELERRENGDGCCPEGADWSSDDDCPARCGNGVIERDERCDPPGTCKKQASCVSKDACERAHYEGDPDRCSARCEVVRIESCVSEDGCCPTGCAPENDSDCQRVLSEPEPAAFDCARDHAKSPCQACDCARCGAQVAACLGDTLGDNAALCGDVIDCGEATRCIAGACYCGAASVETCTTGARGPCAAEFHAAAMSTNAQVVFLQDGNPSYTLGRGVAVLACRKASCAAECGL